MRVVIKRKPHATQSVQVSAKFLKLSDHSENNT